MTEYYYRSLKDSSSILKLVDTDQFLKIIYEQFPKLKKIKGSSSIILTKLIEPLIQNTLNKCLCINNTPVSFANLDDIEPLFTPNKEQCTNTIYDELGKFNKSYNDIFFNNGDKPFIKLYITGEIEIVYDLKQMVADHAKLTLKKREPKDLYFTLLDERYLINKKLSPVINGTEFSLDTCKYRYDNRLKSLLEIIEINKITGTNGLHGGDIDITDDLEPNRDIYGGGVIDDINIGLNRINRKDKSKYMKEIKYNSASEKLISSASEKLISSNSPKVKALSNKIMSPLKILKNNNIHTNSKIKSSIGSLPSTFSNNSSSSERQLNKISSSSVSQDNNTYIDDYITIKNDTLHNKLLCGIEMTNTINIDDYIYISISEITENHKIDKVLKDLVNFNLDFNEIYKRLYKFYPCLIQYEEKMNKLFKDFWYHYFVKWIPCKVLNIIDELIILEPTVYYLCNDITIEIKNKINNKYNVLDQNQKYIWKERERQYDLYKGIGYNICWTYNDDCIFKNSMLGIIEFIINPYKKICSNVLLKKQFKLNKELPLNINLTYQSIVRTMISNRYIEYINIRNKYYSRDLILTKEMSMNDYMLYSFMIENQILENMGVNYNLWLHHMEE